MDRELVKETHASEEARVGKFFNLLKIPHTWYIAVIVLVCSILYYLDLILDLVGLPNPSWSTFLITHDLHLFFFAIPLLYAAYVFRERGIVLSSVVVFLVFICRIAFQPNYLEPFFSAMLFTGFITLLGILIAYVQSRRIQIAAAYAMVKQHAEKLMIAETAINTCVSAIATANLEGDLTYVNPAFLKIWRYKNAEDVLGKNFTRLCDKEEEARELFQTLRKTRETEAYELVGKRKDGQKFIIGLKASLIIDAEGQPIGITASMADITNRFKKTEHKEATPGKSR